MTNLNKILKQMGPQYPVHGIDGYGGEMDGSEVVFMGAIYFKTRENAKKIDIGPAVGIHWAEYDQISGWTVVLAYWSDADPKDVWIQDENDISTGLWRSVR